MKQSLFLGLVGAAALLAGCNDGKLPGGWSSSTGGIAPTVSVDASVATGSRALNTAKAIEAADLSLRLIAADGSLDRTWAKVADFDAEEEFAVGDYTMQAFYGTEGAEGFDAPYYTGSTALSVRENQSTPVSVTARLANSMVSINYTDAFKNYLSDWSASISSDAGSSTIEYGKDETRPAYITPGTVTLKIDVTKPNGVSASLQAASFNAVARHHYNVTIDLNNGEVGEAVITITYDGDTEEKTITIDLSDDIISAPAPELTAVGFASGDVITHVESAEAANPLKLNIIARGGIASVRMTTESATLRQQGWPAELDLIAADAAMQATLRQLGLKPLGIWQNPDKMAVIDLTDVLAHLSVTAAGATESSFAFEVTDRYTKTSEPVSLTVNLIKLNLEITGHGAMLYDADNVDLTLAYNGSDIENNVAIQVKNDRGTWDNLTINSVESASEGVYTVNVALPSRADKALTFRATSKTGLTSGEVEVPVVEPNVTLEGRDLDTFATYTLVKAGGEAAEGMQFEYSTDGGETYTKTTSTAMADGYFRVSGLPAASTVLVRVNDADHASRPVTVNTEAATQLPNAKMENWYQTKAAHSQTTGFGMDAYVVYPSLQGENSFWSTRNALTTATGSGPTPYYVSYSGTRSTAGVSGNAAEISTLGYGEGSTFTGSGGTCKHKAAGMLFIGEHSATSETSEVFDYGKPFTSRPTGFSFSYKYIPYNNDSMKAYIVVENRDNGVVELGRGEIVSADNVSSFTKATVNINYTDTSKKATHMYIVFCSSSDLAIDAPGVKNVKGSKSFIEGYADSRRVGSVLTVDDIELIY